MSGSQEYTHDYGIAHQYRRAGPQSRAGDDWDFGSTGAVEPRTQSIRPGDFVGDTHEGRVGSTSRSPASASPTGIPERRAGESSGVTASTSGDTFDVLIDTASWINHGRIPDALITAAIERGCVVTHHDVVGEIALGCGPTAVATAERIGLFRHVTDVSNAAVLAFIRTHQLSCTGVGMIDARLIAACALADRPTRLYSADKRLMKEARRVGVSLT